MELLEKKEESIKEILTAKIKEYKYKLYRCMIKKRKTEAWQKF